MASSPSLSSPTTPTSITCYDKNGIYDQRGNAAGPCIVKVVYVLVKTTRMGIQTYAVTRPHPGACFWRGDAAEIR